MKNENVESNQDSIENDGDLSGAAMGSTESNFKTSKRILYATDRWGNTDKTHLEIEWRGRTLMIDITDENIHFVGPCFNVDKHSLNAMDITPYEFKAE